MDPKKKKKKKTREWRALLNSTELSSFLKKITD
jgi:hypothetical protein